jgi:hypothetical protein
MKNASRLIVLLCGLVFLAGCTIRIVDFTVISSKNVKVPTKARGQRATGKDCIFVFFFPFGIPNMKEAIDRAIEGAGGDYDALVDGVVYQENNFFVIGQMCYRVEGTPINTKASTSMKEFEGKELLRHSSQFTAPSFQN